MNKNFVVYLISIFGLLICVSSQQIDKTEGLALETKFNSPTFTSAMVDDTPKCKNAEIMSYHIHVLFWQNSPNHTNLAMQF